MIERTNYLLENLNHDIKHGERRRSGRKELTRDLENLLHPKRYFVGSTWCEEDWRLENSQQTFYPDS